MVNVQSRVFEALGHQGPRELLKTHHKMRPGPLIILAQVRIESQQEKALDEVELEQQSRVGVARAFDRGGQLQPILLIRGAIIDVASVNRKISQHLDKRALETVKGDIRSVPVAAGDTFEQMR